MIGVDDPQYLRAIHPDHEKGPSGQAHEDPSRRSRNARTTRVTARRQSNGLIRDGPYTHVSVRDHGKPKAGPCCGEGASDEGSSAVKGDGRWAAARRRKASTAPEAQESTSQRRKATP